MNRNTGVDPVKKEFSHGSVAKPKKMLEDYISKSGYSDAFDEQERSNLARLSQVRCKFFLGENVANSKERR